MSDVFAKLRAEFPKDKISWRAQATTKDGSKAQALAYIDARDVQDRLDEAVGAANWQNRYTHAENKTVCEIGIRIDGEWIWKADGAGDSDIEAEKGALSDAFKRAAVKWGIGRYLYDFPAAWVPCESYDGPNGKKKFSRFTADPWAFVKYQGPTGAGMTNDDTRFTKWADDECKRLPGLTRDEVEERVSSPRFENAMKKLKGIDRERHARLSALIDELTSRKAA